MAAEMEVLLDAALFTVREGTPVRWADLGSLDKTADRVLEAMRSAGKKVTVFAGEQLARTVRGALVCDVLADKGVPVLVTTDLVASLKTAGLKEAAAVEVVSREAALVNAELGDRLFHAWRFKSDGVFLVRSDPRRRKNVTSAPGDNSKEVAWATWAITNRPVQVKLGPTSSEEATDFEGWVRKVYGMKDGAPLANIRDCPEALRVVESNTPLPRHTDKPRASFITCRACGCAFMFTAEEKAIRRVASGLSDAAVWDSSRRLGPCVARCGWWSGSHGLPPVQAAAPRRRRWPHRRCTVTAAGSAPCG